MSAAPVAVLFARADSHYKSFDLCDVWDQVRDARRWPGGTPVVAHPPCRAWGQMRRFVTPADGEKDLALLAVEHVRRYGGVLEHPAGSTLWKAAGLPRPRHPSDSFGGYSIEVDQVHWGHKARKRTWIYIVGCSSLPKLPPFDKVPTHVVRPTRGGLGHKYLTKAEREATPEAFARWLLAIALRSRVWNC